VVDELGDPPRSGRYAEVAAAREDLPPLPTVRARLGPWSGIAAALTEAQAARDGRDPVQPKREHDRGTVGESGGHGAAGESGGRATAGESIETERLPSQVEVAALRQLLARPGSSGAEVRRGARIRSASQTSTLLARLEREGLLVNERGGSEKAYRNAWRLSERGRAVLNGLPEGMYAV
jgi:hypothetical protein